MERVSVSLVNLALRTAVHMGIDRQKILDRVEKPESILQNSANYVINIILGK